MKISYRTHPALELLSGNYTKIWIDEKDREKFMAGQYFFKEGLDRLISSINKTNIIKPSMAFQTAAWEACKRQAFDKETEFSEELHGESGVLLLNDRVTYFCIKQTPQKNIAVQFVTFDNDQNMLLDFCFESGTGVNNVAVWKSLTLQMGSVLEDKKAYMMWVKANIICIVLFKKYAKVETRELPAGQKVKDIDCKYINETKSNITYLTSTWFTNLVKSDAFKVRGHFRLQPKKKDGEWTKELIWISEFQKDGYTRRAGKLIEENQSV